MDRTAQIVLATAGVFIGSLLADVVFGDGIQAEDLNGAAMVALLAALVQVVLTRKQPR